MPPIRIAEQRLTVLAALQQFFSTPLDMLFRRHATASPEQAALTLFQAAVTEVPAYQDFLEQQGITARAIHTMDAFRKLPLVTKDNYLRAYPLPQRCRSGKLSTLSMVALSSGSTGKPMLWPRGTRHELDVATRFEQIFLDSFQAEARTTLAVVCFALGNWVGGMYTVNCCRYLAQKGYPITLATPGNNKDEILRIVTEMGAHYDQVVLLGYPPFVKDVIDTGLQRGIQWADYHIKMVFAGEVYSEEWRTLICQRAGASDPTHDTAALYGTADAGVLGCETPLSIHIRRLFALRPELARDLFGEARLPTLVQYDPMTRYFETHENTLVLTADPGTPLVRYHLADKGGIIPYEDMLRFLRDNGIEPLTEFRDGHHRTRALPFVYLFGRADFTVSYYGANVYPENITVGLERPDIAPGVSGKFVLETKETKEGNKILQLTVELAPNVHATPKRAAAIAAAVKEELLRLNSEYANYVPPKDQTPTVTLKNFGDAEYFPVGVKHRYTRS